MPEAPEAGWVLAPGRPGPPPARCPRSGTSSSASPDDGSVCPCVFSSVTLGMTQRRWSACGFSCYDILTGEGG